MSTGRQIETLTVPAPPESPPVEPAKDGPEREARIICAYCCRPKVNDSWGEKNKFTGAELSQADIKYLGHCKAGLEKSFDVFEVVCPECSEKNKIEKF